MRKKMRGNASVRLPAGWDRARIQRLIEYYDNQTEDEAVAEYEAAGRGPGQTLMSVPTAMVPAVRALLASAVGCRPRQCASNRVSKASTAGRKKAVPV